MPNSRFSPSDLPSIAADVLASFAEQAPSRVKKRLDKNPQAAEEWSIQTGDGQFTIAAGEESVTLRPNAQGCLDAPDTLECTCLLSPKCFHILAIVSLLKASVGDTPKEAAEDPGDQESTAQNDQNHSHSSEAEVALSGQQRRIAERVLVNLESVLAGGVRSAGIVQQSDIIRTAHDCRCEKLINLSNSLMRVAEGIHRIRSRDDHANSNELLGDFCRALHQAKTTMRRETAAPDFLGFTRRPFHPVKLSRLDALCCQPILTLSGYAGICIYFVGNDGQVYTVVQSRPGDSSHAHEAYQGGVDLGGLTIAARELCRASLDVQNLTASPDGRLGKGQRTRWAVRKTSATPAEHGWLSAPFPQQLKRVVDAANLGMSSEIGSSPLATADSLSMRPGWDLVCVRGRLVGSHGTSLLLELDQQSDDPPATLKLVLPSDSEHLRAFANFQLLATKLGLRLSVVGRMQLDAAGSINALCIWPDTDDHFAVSVPEKLEDCYQLAFDTIEPHEIRQLDTAHTAAPEQVFTASRQLSTAAQTSTLGTGLPADGLRNRMLGLLLGGRRAFNSVADRTLAKERQALTQFNLPTAASLHRCLQSASESGNDLLTVFAACDLFLSAATTSRNSTLWSNLFASE